MHGFMLMKQLKMGNLVMMLMMLILMVKRDSNGKASRKRGLVFDLWGEDKYEDAIKFSFYEPTKNCYGKKLQLTVESTNSERIHQCLYLLLLNKLLSTMVVMQIMISLLLQLLDPLRNCRGKIGRLAMEVEFNRQ
ncbi:hypothetical protein SLEP1_g56236 [Rubroshorea leprosula]|uniref:Uncharacterized protein n=1 Tax=Rubroshorea leprosula TaxID=152421 RepID=A0AAV5MIZ3_9ROSI|nr:hypothetical protein SLEP1_g56236 [Rubroshorea leprosula]